MSLRKSPARTPALVAANRRNARKSTGPKTARGKAWSRLNHLQDGGHSREYRRFYDALLDAPPGRMAETAEALLSSKPIIHPLFTELAELAIEAEIQVCADVRWMYGGRE